MARFIKYASVENRDIKGIIELKDWNTWKTSFERLVNDLVEYLLLYYMELANEKMQKPSIKLIEVDRNMLTDFVLNNKIFSLFTESTEKRVMFGNKKVEESVVVAFSSGAFYEKLVIRLPEKCILRRIDKGIELDNDMFSLKISYIFNERVSGKILSKCFTEKYVKCCNGGIGNSSLKLNIVFNPKLKSLFFRTLELYSWVDEYVNFVFKAFSFDDFLKRINWDMLEAEEHLKNESKQID